MIDKIQKRYSWTDEQIQELYYCRFFEICDLLEKVEKEEMKVKTFQTWQIVNCNLTKPMSFQEYYSNLFPSEKDSIEQKEKNKMESQQIIDEIEAVLQKRRC